MATGGKLGRSQIDASDALHDFSCTPCTEDGKNTEALFQCTDCQIFYCQRCVSGHNKFTRNHNVLEKASKLFGKGQRQQKSTATRELPADLCEEHHGEVIKMFCGQHDLVCCSVCIAVKHRSCEGVEYIPNIAKDLLNWQDNDKTKTALEKVKDDLQTLKSEMEDELKGLAIQRDGILDDIQKFKTRLIKRVEELEEASVKEVLAKHKALAHELNACRTEIGDIIDGVDERLDKLKRTACYTETQAFVDIKYGEKQVSVGNDCIDRFNGRNMETLKFELNESLLSHLREVQSFGTTIAESAHKDSTVKSILAPHLNCGIDVKEEAKRGYMLAHKRETKYTCPQCGKRFNDRISFIWHTASVCKVK